MGLVLRQARVSRAPTFMRQATLQTSATLRNLKCYGLRQQKSTRARASEKLLWVLPDAGDAVAHEANEDGFGGRLAINPVLDVVSLRITLANFVFWLADRGHHFFAIHSNCGTAILNGFLHFGRQ